MRKSNKPLLAILAVAVVLVLGLAVLTMPDRRSTGERIGDAIDTLPEQGVGEAAEELERRTPGERLGDAIEDTADRD